MKQTLWLNPRLSKPREFSQLCMLAFLICLMFTLSFYSLNAAANANSTATLAQPNAEQNPQPTSASVTLFNRKIVTFYAESLGMSVTRRVERAQLVIQEHLKLSGPNHISTIADPVGTIVKMDDDAVFIITNEDISNANALSGDEVIKSAVNTLQQVTIEYKQSHDSEFIIRALINTGLALVAFIALLWLLRHIKHRAEAWLLTFTQIKTLNLGGVETHIRQSIRWLIKYAVLSFYWLFNLIISYELISFVLEQFPHSRAWGEQLHNHLLNLATRIGLSILQAIPDLFTAFIIFMLARFVAKTSNALFDSVSSGHTKIHWIQQDVAGTTKRIVNIVIWLFAFVMAYPYLPGSGTEAFKGISVLVGLMLSLGASSLVSQAGSGLILTYTRMFRAGEYVSIGEHEGTVVELGMFTTRIRNGMGIELALPNSYILSEVTKNYSRMVHGGTGFMIDATVTIGYDTPWRQVEAMLTEAANRTKGVVNEFKPKVFQVALADFYPEYRLVCQAIPTDAKQRAEVISMLHANIQDVFNEYGVQIMSPHYFDDPQNAKTVPIHEWYKAPSKPTEK